MSEFEEQLKQEELARQQSEEGETNPYEYRDSDGTLYEWDTEKSAWFPKIDADFIAKYQMSYGVDQSAQPGDSQGNEAEKSESKQEYSKEEYEKYWRDYYNYYYGQQPDQATPGEKQEGQDVSADLESTGKEVQASGQMPREQGLSDDDPDSHYHHYFSQYYDENYVAPAAGNQGQPESDAKEDTDKGENATGKKKPGKAGEKRKSQPESGWVEIEDDKNTNVYVSGLPLDVTDDEFQEFMSKCGLIMPDLVTKEPKIKLYRDENGEPKGDGRCCYTKVESVALALQILDGYDLRGHTVHVERAKFTMKGKFDPKKKRKKLAAKEKKKLQLQQQKLLDWKPEVDDTRKRWEKVTVLKHMFDPKDFEENPLLINELREDVRQECSKYGEVKKVVLYDRHPEGVMTVHFKEFEFADACVAGLNGRWFAKRRISAEIWDGKTKYEVEESTAERDERLKKWENFLESDDNKNKSAGTSNGDGGASVTTCTTEIPASSETSASGTRDSVTDSGASRTVAEGETNHESAGASQAT